MNCCWRMRGSVERPKDPNQVILHYSTLRGMAFRYQTLVDSLRAGALHINTRNQAGFCATRISAQKPAQVLQTLARSIGSGYKIQSYGIKATKHKPPNLSHPDQFPINLQVQ